MAKTYRVTPFVRITNAIVGALVRRGVPLGGNALLTVTGRTSGEPRTTPITIIERDGERWIQSPFGEVNWVRNLRAAGRGTLTRRGHSEVVAAVELDPGEAAHTYKRILGSFPPMIRGYFDVRPDSPLAAFEREAPRHPIFRIMAADPPRG